MSFDLDENDVLFTNEFIQKPNVSDELNQSLNEEFRKYYQNERDSIDKQRIRKSLEQISFRSLDLSDDTDENNLINTNKVNTSNISLNEYESGTGSIKRYTKEIKTYVNVDSRDRSKFIYNHAHEFKIFLGKTFYNVKSIRLASIEFPNTSAVINTNNNKIYWRNKQDIDLNIIDDITKDYPIYDVTLRTGSYIASTLSSEIENKMSLVKRENKDGNYHYFDISLDISTDVVTFTSLTLTELLNNPFITTKGTGNIYIKLPADNTIMAQFNQGDTIYILGAKTFAGIPTNVINTSHVIISINPSSYLLQIEININASESLTSINGGGGNTVKIGKLAPFQLLFGEKSKTISQNIGYPLENSSESVNIHIENMEDFYQVQITLDTPHNFQQNFDFIGQICTINGSSTTPDIDGVKTITRIINSNTILISVNTPLTIESLLSGQLTFGINTYNITEIVNYNINTVLITSKTPHFLNFSNILSTQITLYNTNTVPSFDGLNTLYGIVSPTKFVIPGNLLSDFSDPKNECTMPHTLPLTTSALNITGITMGLTNTTFSCDKIHNLLPGDPVLFNKLVTTPSISSSTIESVPIDKTLFTISTPITSYNLDLEQPIVKTGYMTLSFPEHHFNNIISIQNTSGSPPGNPSAKLLVVQTQFPHNLETGISNKVYLSNTNCIPLKNGPHNVISILDADLFTISSNTIITTEGTTGILGLNQNFYLYNVKDIGGIIAENINNKLFSVREIIDENTISFYNPYAFATYSDIGGGENIYISSMIHGFSGVQTNTKNNVLNRSINLQGENYVFLCCPQLATMMNTGNVKNIFARITLDQSPGNMVFAYLSNPKNFDTVPLDKLNELDFSVLNYDGSFYDFNDLDYSFTLEITEVKDITDAFNFSSRRGVAN